jgi:hypothetical protein
LTLIFIYLFLVWNSFKKGLGIFFVYRLKIYYAFEQQPPPPPAMKALAKETARLDVPVQVVQQMPKPPKRTEMMPDKQPIPMMPSSLTVHEADFTVKETNPDLGKAVDYNHHYDLVEHMTYLFIRVVRARGLAAKDANGTSDPVSLFLSSRLCSSSSLLFIGAIIVCIWH